MWGDMGRYREIRGDMGYGPFATPPHLCRPGNSSGSLTAMPRVCSASARVPRRPCSRAGMNALARLGCQGCRGRGVAESVSSFALPDGRPQPWRGEAHARSLEVSRSRAAASDPTGSSERVPWVGGASTRQTSACPAVLWLGRYGEIWGDMGRYVRPSSGWSVCVRPLASPCCCVPPSSYRATSPSAWVLARGGSTEVSRKCLGSVWAAGLRTPASPWRPALREPTTLALRCTPAVQCLGRVSDVSRTCLGRVSDVSCLGRVSERADCTDAPTHVMKTNLTACTESARTGFRGVRWCECGRVPVFFSGSATATSGRQADAGQAWAHLGLLVTAALDAQQDVLHLAVIQLAYGGPRGASEKAPEQHTLCRRIAE